MRLDEDTGSEPEDPVEARERAFMASLRDREVQTNLEVRITERQGIPVIQVEGELDLYTADAFRVRLEEVLAGQPQALVVDLTGAPFIDSSGLTLLLRAAHRLEGALAVVSPNERITRLFRATGMGKAIALHRALPQAVEALADFLEE